MEKFLLLSDKVLGKKKGLNKKAKIANTAKDDHTPPSNQAERPEKDREEK